MKKFKTIIIALIAALALAISGCDDSRPINSAKYAIIYLPDGSTIEGRVQALLESEDHVQVKIDGAYYGVDPSDIELK